MNSAMTAQRALFWASSTVSRASSSRIRRWALLSSSFSVANVGAVGDTELPLNRLWALSFDRSAISLRCGLAQISDVNAVGHRIEERDGQGGAVGQVVGAPFTGACPCDGGAQR